MKLNFMINKSKSKFMQSYKFNCELYEPVIYTFNDYPYEELIDKEEAEGICADCGNMGKLIETPCCAHYISVGICCSKMVCQFFCIYNCSNGHINYVKNDNGWIDDIKCSLCDEKWQPVFCWWGRSPYE